MEQDRVIRLDVDETLLTPDLRKWLFSTLPHLAPDERTQEIELLGMESASCSNAGRLHLLGIALFMLDDLRKAYTAFDKAANLEPGDFRNTLNAAVMLVHIGELSSAIERLRQIDGAAESMTSTVQRYIGLLEEALAEQDGADSVSGSAGPVPGEFNPSRGASALPGADLSALSDRRMALAREWDQLIDQVRTLPGFADFLRPPRLESLLPAASDGPVVIVNVSRWRCDALIVTTEGVRPVPLDALTFDDAAAWAERFLKAGQDVDAAALQLEAVGARVVTAPEGEQSLTARRHNLLAVQRLRSARGAAEATLRELNEWLWDTVAEPVLTSLGFMSDPGPDEPWPRLWWCPTGPLTLLPLHSAGHHQDLATAGSRRTVLDRVISSYTPTLRALVEARSGGAPQPQARTPIEERMLVVAVGDIPGQVRLTASDEERDFLLTLLTPQRCTVLEGLAATRDSIGTELASHAWVHFSCHGDQDLRDPSRGGVLVRDGILTVADITASRFRGELASLSACKTALGGVELLDEAVTLAAALHYAGYRHVLATLWSVEQTTAAAIFRDVYARMETGGRLNAATAAAALHHAVRIQREAHLDQPMRWALFTHTGP